MRKAKILIIDDHEPVLELLSTILASYDVTVAANGHQALPALMSAQAFELVLTDVRLPGADGHEVLKAVKTVSPDTEVVMMTAYATVGDAVAGMKEGAFDYLEKPFDPDDVNLVVARALESRRRKLLEATRRMEERTAGGGGAEEISVSMSYREAAEAGRDRASRAYLVALMREFDGKVTRAAERAGMERESLHRLLKRYGIRTQDFKRASGDGAVAPGRCEDAAHQG